MPETQPNARPLRVPVRADSVGAPVVVYDDMPRIEFLLDDETSWGRVLFEGLDAIRVCRGEHSPYEISDVTEDERWPWVVRVRRSPWQLERHAYEAGHYRGAYEFGGDVDEMLRDFRHYVFLFHDQFVEVIARGIWFESSSQRLGAEPPSPDHPLLALPESEVVQRVTAHGIVCQVRKNPKPLPELSDASELCSQVLYQFAAELDGNHSVSWTLRLRTDEGITKAQWCGYFGKVHEEFDRVPELGELLPRVDAWLGEVAERRRKMGKG